MGQVRLFNLEDEIPDIGQEPGDFDAETFAASVIFHGVARGEISLQQISYEEEPSTDQLNTGDWCVFETMMDASKEPAEILSTPLVTALQRLLKSFVVVQTDPVTGSAGVKKMNVFLVGGMYSKSYTIES